MVGFRHRDRSHGEHFKIVIPKIIPIKSLWIGKTVIRSPRAMSTHHIVEVYGYDPLAIEKEYFDEQFESLLVRTIIIFH